jgi:hypothetical protein
VKLETQKLKIEYAKILFYFVLYCWLLAAFGMHLYVSKFAVPAGGSIQKGTIINQDFQGIEATIISE